MSELQIYESPDITIFFDAKRCIHAGNCVENLPEVFHADGQEPWIHPDQAAADKLAAACESCPSGALTYRRKDGGPEEKKPAINTITLEDNGPLTVHADFTVNWKTSGSYRAILCRCGASKNKPWCDGAHEEAGFRHCCERAVLPASTLPTGLPVNIQPFANGPLLIEGPCEIRNSAGETVICTERTVLCRCGASKNKPYCDASHAAIGFKSE